MNQRSHVLPTMTTGTVHTTEHCLMTVKLTQCQAVFYHPYVKAPLAVRYFTYTI